MKNKLTAFLLCLVMLGMTVMSSGCAFLGSLSASSGNENSQEAADRNTEEPTLNFGETSEDQKTEAADEAETQPIITPGRDVLVGETDPVVSTGDGVIAYDVSAVVESAMPAMVNIAVVTSAGTSYETQSSGSGILMASDESYLYIMTNNHVVSGSSVIKVTFADGATYNAQIKGTDSSYDLAVVLVDVTGVSDQTLSAIRVARIGDSRKLRLGQGAVAIGNSLGYGQTVTSGIISAVDRQVELSDGGLSVPLVQTDAAINPGNSGGALLNHDGEVIGINSMKFASATVEGTGFAIPISDALPILQELIDSVTYGEEERGQLGISVYDVTAAHMVYYGMPAGVCVKSVTQNGPAHKAGIKAGDIICAANGRPVKNVQSLLEFLSRHTGGEQVQITLKRQSDMGDYVEHEVTVTLAVKAALPS